MPHKPHIEKIMSGDAFLARRYRRERWFRHAGLGALLLAGMVLALLLGGMVLRAHGGLWQHMAVLPVEFDAAMLEITAPLQPQELPAARVDKLVSASLRNIFPEVTQPGDWRRLRGLISRGAEGDLRRALRREPSRLGTRSMERLRLSDDADLYFKGKLDARLPELERRLSDREIQWLEDLKSRGMIKRDVNIRFFTAADSRQPELAGIAGSFVGSLWLMLVCILLALPLSVMAAVYMEEFAPKNRWTDALEITVNNLAAVPSVIYGLLGLTLYLHMMDLPRSSALVGGLTLALLILPVIIIATRAALRAVPASIRDGARALGATPMQVVAHHVLPLAVPGIMTGSILGLARAIGETAPLLMIGMVAFIADIPTGLSDPATAMPVQVYLWADSPEPAYAEKTALLILVLLAVLVAMNSVASYIRRKFERRW